MLKDFRQEEFDILVQAGQSNSEGCGMGVTPDPYVPDGRVWYLNGDVISLAADVVWWNNPVTNFSLSFARRYVSSGMLEEGRKLLIVRTAIGGTGFSDHRWGLKDDLFLRMMEMTKTALALNPQNRIKAFLWHQGETDAFEKAEYAAHKKNLESMVDAFRNAFDAAEVPFIAGDFVQFWKKDNMEISEPVVRAIRDVCAQLKCAAFVETDGLTSNQEENGGEDAVHFSRKALYELGERYFEAYRSLIGQ